MNSHDRYYGIFVCVGFLIFIQLALLGKGTVVSTRENENENERDRNSFDPKKKETKKWQQKYVTAPPIVNHHHNDVVDDLTKHHQQQQNLSSSSTTTTTTTGNNNNIDDSAGSTPTRSFVDPAGNTTVATPGMLVAPDPTTGTAIVINQTTTRSSTLKPISPVSRKDDIVTATSTVPFPIVNHKLIDLTKHQQDQNQEKEKKKVVYTWMHVPKTAGSSMYNAFVLPLYDRMNQTVYPPAYRRNRFTKNVELFNRAHVLQPPCGQTNVNGRLIIGVHCAASEITDCVENKLFANHTASSEVEASNNKQGSSSSIVEAKFLTVLRHPVDRVLSEYSWWLEEPARWTDSMNSNKADIVSWIKDPTNVAHNRQAMYFLMDTRLPQKPAKYEPRGVNCIPFLGRKAHDWIKSHYGSVANFNDMNVSDVDWKMDRFSFIGLLDHLDASKKKFRYLFNITSTDDSSSDNDGNNNNTTTTTSKNTATATTSVEDRKMPKIGSRNHLKGDTKHASDKIEVGPEIRKLIEERNRLDMILYEKVKQSLYYY